MVTQEIRLADICELPDAQHRADGVNPEVVSDYAEAMADGAAFPPIVVFQDKDGIWPADGFHRIEAARKISRETILADVREGDARQAILFAAGANANHGLRRSAQDKRCAVTALLNDKEWFNWSDREIGKRCSVHHSTVSKIRREIVTGELASDRTYRTKHGTIATMKTKAGESQSGTSVVDRLIRDLPDDKLIEECRRRGFEVTA